jgi:hypothetical protein
MYEGEGESRSHGSLALGNVVGAITTIIFFGCGGEGDVQNTHPLHPLSPINPPYMVAALRGSGDSLLLINREFFSLKLI